MSKETARNIKESPSMKPMLLSLNTCGVTGSVALGRVDLNRGQVAILSKANLAGRAYSAELIPTVARLLGERGATIHDLHAIIVVRGPGSFTGIRVGLSAAKGLAEAAAIPIIAISRLALLAGVSGFPHVLAAVDAGRGEYYVGHYRGAENLGEVLMGGAEACIAAQRPGAGVLVCEENPEKSQNGVLAQCNPVYLQSPHAADAFPSVLERLRARAFENVETLDGNYLRRSDAEILGPSARQLG